MRPLKSISRRYKNEIRFLKKKRIFPGEEKKRIKLIYSIPP